MSTQLRSCVLPLLYLLVIAGNFAVMAQAPVPQAERFDIAVVAIVTQKGVSSLAAVPGSSNNLTARVEKVLEKPSSVVIKTGDTLTIVVKDPRQFTEGMRALFYASGWIYGQGIAVREVSHETLPLGVGSSADALLGQFQARQNDQDLRSRVADADLVVVGRVTKVRSPDGLTTSGISGVSEHHPQWREAVIKIQSALKGSKGQQQIVVRFPMSRDVAWRDVPKFQEGQAGTFILKKDVVSGSPRAAGDAKVSAYTALDRNDVLPAERAAYVGAIAHQESGIAPEK